MYKLNGIIKTIKAEEKISDSFTKREFVVDIPGSFPNPIPLQMTNAHCSDLNGFKEGDAVQVYFYFRGNESKEGKVFVNLEAYKIKAD